MIDGRKGIFTQSGNDSKDPLMKHVGIYWLDEDKNGMASKLVMIYSDLPWTNGAEKIINTIRVEGLSKKPT